MSPRAFDPAVVQARLALMQELLEDLRSLGSVSAERLQQERLLRHAVERLLALLVELAVSINSHVAATVGGTAPGDYRSSFEHASRVRLIPPELAQTLQPSVGMRNVLAPEYAAIDLQKVAAAVEPALRDYGSYVTAASRWLIERSS